MCNQDQNTAQTICQAGVEPGLEDWNYVVETKQSWRVLPDHMKVMEFSGKGDPFFGGNACDLVLGKCGRILHEPTVGPDEGAVFATIEEAHEAAKRIPNRRVGSILGVLPVWERPRVDWSKPMGEIRKTLGEIADWERRRERTVAERYPRLLAALTGKCLLTQLEARCVLCRQEPEAVLHLGGWQKAIQAAWESRHR